MVATDVHEPGLRRGAIGLGDALAGTLANMAPVEGIFIVLVIVAAAMGTLTPWAFVLGAVGILLTGWNFSQLARRVPSAGSYVGFAYHGAGAIKRSWAAPAGAFTFYLSLIAGPVTIAAVVVFLGSWLQTAASLANAWWLVIALAVLLLTSPIPLRGIVASSRTAILLFCTEAGGLLLISLIILARSGGAITAPLHAHGGHPGGFGGLVGITFAVAVSGFVGWENSAGLAEEIRQPRKVIPVAILGSISVVAVIYLIATWAATAGYIHWMGVKAGAARLGDVTNAAPFLELADHYAHWFHWGIVAIGVISATACYLAALTACSRWTFASARAGLLPRQLARVSRTHVPANVVWLWIGLIAVLCVVPYFLLHGNAVLVAGYEAGIGTVPLLFIYVLVSALTPIYVWRHDRANFSILSHVVPGFAGVAVVGYGVYEFVLPNQPSPANTFWIYILAIFVLAAAAAAVAVRLRGPAVSRLGQVAQDEPEAPAPSPLPSPFSDMSATETGQA
jgi:amino acid transporter